MAIKHLDQVSCSLNLGYIYNVDYSFEPERGVKITLFFVNENGVYPGIPATLNTSSQNSILSALNSCQISIGSANFIVYPISYSLEQNNDRKILKVEFWDDNFKLDNYYVVLGNRGCGPNTFSLGKPFQYLNPVSVEEQQRWILEQYTTFVDLEYIFSDFLNVLSSIFPVSLNASVDPTIQRNFTGSFREVLNNWCSYLNLAYFFQNGTIYIYDPFVLQGQLQFPIVPGDALDYSFSESLEGTYSKVSSMFIESDGGQFNVSPPTTPQSILSLTLFPVGSRFNDPQINIDNNQVIASLFGRQFYFLYNYYNQLNIQRIQLSDPNQTQVNYFTNIGVTDLPISSAKDQTVSIIQSMSQNNISNIINFDSNIFEQQFSRFYDYGTKVAGRFYQTDELNDFTRFNGFTFKDTAGNSVSLTEFTTPTSGGFNLDKTFVIEQSQQGNFEGLQSNGNARYIYYDNGQRDTGVFLLTSDQQESLNQIFNIVTNGFEGSQAMDISAFGFQQASAFLLPSQPSFLNSLFLNAINTFSLIPIFKTIGIQGYKPIQPINQGSTGINNYYPAGSNLSVPVFTTSSNNGLPPPIILPPPPAIGTIIPGSNISDNISQAGSFVLRQNSDFVAYYSKIAKCIFAANGVGSNVLNNRFVTKSESVDVPILFSMHTDKYGQSYSLDRDVSVISNNIWDGEVKNTAGARTFTTKNMSFMLNYFYNIGSNYVTMGLVGLNVSVDENGIKSTYHFSNNILGVQESEAISDQIERSIRNSIKRQFYLDHFKGYT